MQIFRLSFMFLFIFQFVLTAEDLSSDYQTKKALEKQELLFKQIENSKYQKLPTVGVSFFDMINLFDVKYLTKTISHQSDEMPAKRKRLIHTYGAVAKITFKPSIDTPYTGLFKSIVPAIIRASVVRYDPNNLMPGIAVKFLVDGAPSVNTLGLHNIDGQGKDYNFFANPFSNIIPPPKSSLMVSVLDAFTKAAKIFNQEANAMKVSLNDFARINSDGSNEDNPISPEQIFFYPTKDVLQDSKDNRDFRIKLSELPIGTKLFDLYAKNPDSTNDLLLIGEITLDSPFIASKYGDEKIFFQHTVK